MLELKGEFAPTVDLQIVAFPQEGMATHPEGEVLMREALLRGADVVGGHLSIADSPEALHAETDAAFRLAIEFDRDIDVHVDLDLDRRKQFRTFDGRLGVVHLSQRTIAEGYEHRVTASHVAALGEVDPNDRDRAIELMARAGVSAVVMPASNLYGQARSDSVRVRRGVAPLEALMKGGVRVAIGTDNIRDPFNPFSSADPLLHATVAALACHMVGDADFVTLLRLMSVVPSSILGTGRHDLEPGAEGDVVIFQSQSMDELLNGLANRFAIIRRGSRADEAAA
jgi:cytosine deaminase